LAEHRAKNKLFQGRNGNEDNEAGLKEQSNRINGPRNVKHGVKEPPSHSLAIQNLQKDAKNKNFLQLRSRVN